MYERTGWGEWNWPILQWTSNYKCIKVNTYLDTSVGYVLPGLTCRCLSIQGQGTSGQTDFCDWSLSVTSCSSCRYPMIFSLHQGTWSVLTCPIHRDTSRIFKNVFPTLPPEPSFIQTFRTVPHKIPCVLTLVFLYFFSVRILQHHLKFFQFY